jgi:hypothetical protein
MDDQPAQETFPTKEYLVAQFEALREEILKDMDAQNQLIGLTLLIAGTFLSLGTQQSVAESTLMVYPLLAVFLAALWSDKQVGIVRIGTYIRDRFDSYVDEQWRWETYVAKVYQNMRTSRNVWGVRGLFMVTQTLALVLALTRFHSTLVDEVGAGIDLIAIGVTFMLLHEARRNEAAARKGATSALKSGDAAHKGPSLATEG